MNARLDHVKAYNSEKHYIDYRYMARRWVERWGDILASEITEGMIRDFVSKRREVSSDMANKEIRYLRATFNFAKKRMKLLDSNPAEAVAFFPRNKRKKRRYIPTPEEIDKIIACADRDTQDYLWTIRETMGG